jgi:mRNA interferase RelE/StbE
MRVTYSKAVIKDVRNIKDEKLISKIEMVVNQLKSAKSIEEISQLKKIKGHPAAHRIRIGDYRLGLYITADLIELVRFVKRNDIYKLFP